MLPSIIEQKLDSCALFQNYSSAWSEVRFFPSVLWTV